MPPEFSGSLVIWPEEAAGQAAEPAKEQTMAEQRTETPAQQQQQGETPQPQQQQQGEAPRGRTTPQAGGASTPKRRVITDWASI